MFTDKWFKEHPQTCAGVACVAFFFLIFIGFLGVGIINGYALFFMAIAAVCVPIGYHLDYKELEKKKKED